jgi:hypothetical protein
MYFMLDENVPQDVADMLIAFGHKAEFIREYVPVGAPDQVVATASRELEAISHRLRRRFRGYFPQDSEGPAETLSKGEPDLDAV